METPHAQFLAAIRLLALRKRPILRIKELIQALF